MAEVTHLVTAGNHDPAGPPVHENNVWLVGDDSEVLVIDPAHDARAVAAAVAGRRVSAILLTHGHWDHLRAVRDFAALVGFPPILLGRADEFLWAREHGDAPFTTLEDGAGFTVADTTVTALATPGHTPGSTSFHVPDLGAVFTGDTLFKGGPGATRWDYSDFSTILESIRTRLFGLPDDTAVHTGHGPSTTIAAERPHLEEWRERGW
ncbi:MBL fold metallo-hydrolase [Tessaracoccus sp. OS52]|uniref:MBL fold metallo-hydrolase n=1 Tax=Tessaracoccus sp. OS52 TaxID=2886691 RepID=UPI001D128D34|nr:MBL fold metallo-hydrolase [Tessaracoccus sp. OS52]MCC2593665.1 MBL fold metallo-hydrolase [Tessaracoccus sp. OS52]